MDTVLKAFLANLGAHIGGSSSDAAVECVRIATHVQSLAGCLPNGASPQATKVDMTVASTPSASTDPAPALALEAELADAKATITRLQDEIASLKAAPKAEKASAPAAPKAAKSTKATTGLTDQGKLKALVIDGTEIPVRSWRSGAVVMMTRVYTSGNANQVHSGWFTTVLRKDTLKMDGVDDMFADSPGTLVVCEKRIRKAAEVLGVSVTLRIAAEDGTTQDVSL